MRKNITLAIILLTSVITGYAKQADQSLIRKVALNFYFEHSRLTEGFTYSSIGIRQMTPTNYNGRTVYYTIRLNPKGWIIVAADDAVTPVLAYSFEDNMNSSSLPPQYISWMEKYQKQINDAVTRNLPASAGISADWEKYSNYDQNQPLDPQMIAGVDPLIIHTWDQGYPYNIDCPQDAAGPGGHPYAGCVATAMSQLMYYYRYPVTGNGQHCYTPSGYPQQCADFGATAYDWNSMVNSLTGADLHSDSAVGLLLWHAGIAVNMMYSASGSGAYSEDARNALVNNFRYSSNAWYIHRSDFASDSWDSIIRSNIDKKMPVYYDGYGAQGGHAFNCDGYQGTNHFHFNWGWSGTANGYYYLDNLNPAGDNFSQGEGSIVNIFPDTTANTYPYVCQTQTVLHSIAGTFDDGSGPVLGYRNNSQCAWLVAPESSEDSVQSITLTFNTFNTTAGSGIVRIYKGSGTSDTLAGEFSGDALPPSITINGTKALVTFSTGQNDQGQGWFLSYAGQIMDWCKDNTTLTDTTGILTDGSFHFNYHNSTTCRWRIIPSGTPGPLTLSFTAFNTQKDHDIVSIYDFGTGESLAEYSGDYSGSAMPAAVTAKSGQMFIMFTSDKTITDAGWEARFSTALGCNNITNVPEVQIYPVPASGYLYVRTPVDRSGEMQVQISDVNGLTVLMRELNNDGSAVKIDVSGLHSGMYFLRITTGTGSIVKKIVIE